MPVYLQEYKFDVINTLTQTRLNKRTDLMGVELG